MVSFAGPDRIAPVISLADRRVDRAGSSDTDRATAVPSAAEQRTHNTSVTALARRGMSEEELRRLLRSRGCEPAAVEAELERLREARLIDDAALAEQLVRTLHERKGLSRSALSHELQRRKLPSECIEQALSALDGNAERIAARVLALRRSSQLARLDPEVAERRLTGYLMRKGYSGAELLEAVRAAMSSGPAAHADGAAASPGRTVRFR